MLLRGVAQFGRVPEWGSGGRGFESSHSDQKALSILQSAFFLKTVAQVVTVLA